MFAIREYEFLRKYMSIVIGKYFSSTRSSEFVGYSRVSNKKTCIRAGQNQVSNRKKRCIPCIRDHEADEKKQCVLRKMVYLIKKGFSEF